MNAGTNEQRDWSRIDYRPAIPDLQPLPVLQHVPPGSTVLDIGCNKGGNAILLAEHGYRVLGIDINGPAIEAARIRAQQLRASGSAHFSVANILEEPVTGRFDCVLLIRVLTCFAELSEWDRVLQRATQLLNPHGCLYIHDFLLSPDIPAYCERYEAAARLGWRKGNFQVNDAQGNRLFMAHHHSQAEVDSIRQGFETLTFRSHESLSLHGNPCRMFEFLGQKRA